MPNPMYNALNSGSPTDPSQQQATGAPPGSPGVGASSPLGGMYGALQAAQANGGTQPLQLGPQVADATNPQDPRQQFANSLQQATGAGTGPSTLQKLYAAIQGNDPYTGKPK